MFDSFWSSNVVEEEEEEEYREEEEENDDLLYYLPDGTRNLVTNPLANMVRDLKAGAGVGVATRPRVPPAHALDDSTSGAAHVRHEQATRDAAAAARSSAGPEAYRMETFAVGGVLTHGA
jgi:hypothetical protein